MLKKKNLKYIYIKKLKNTNATITAAKMLCTFHTFSVFVGVCSSICSPVIKLQSACCFTEQSTYTVYSQILLVVGLTRLIWAFQVGRADRGWSFVAELQC